MHTIHLSNDDLSVSVSPTDNVIFLTWDNLKICAFAELNLNSETNTNHSIL